VNENLWNVMQLNVSCCCFGTAERVALLAKTHSLEEFIMKKLMLMCLVFVCMASAASAIVVDIYPNLTADSPLARMGSVMEVIGSIHAKQGKSVTSNELVHVGDQYIGFTWDVGVVKFALADNGVTSSSVITGARMGLYMYKSGPGYFKIDQYDADNSGPILMSDWGPAGSTPTAAVTQVGGVHQSVVDGYMWFDLTAAVQADAAAGKTYSSYLISPCEPDGSVFAYNPATEINMAVIFDGWGEEQWLPQLEIIPEPATMGLLMLGSLFILRKKKA